jgi:hypothetical protein
MTSRCFWEAKGTKLEKQEVRRQICGFANSHEGGYLILGAERVSNERPEPKWQLDGVQFPDEPRTWIAEIVGDPERGVRPKLAATANPRAFEDAAGAYRCNINDDAGKDDSVDVECIDPTTGDCEVTSTFQYKGYGPP